jgi:tetratricopeptide (TPR) repeat protein
LAALLLTILPPEPATAQSEPITPQGIERAIADLANDDFNTREQATDYLIRAGKHAEEAVKKAVQSEDLEVRQRAQLALEQIKLAPPIDTPPEAVKLAERYLRETEPINKGPIVRQLYEKKAYNTALKLVAEEPNQLFREKLLEYVQPLATAALKELLTSQQDDQAEQFCLRAAEVQDVMPNLAVVLRITGRLPTRLAEWEAEYAAKPSPKLAARIATLARAAGDRDKALRYADLTDNDSIQLSFAVDAGNWSRAAEVYRKSHSKEPMTAAQQAKLATLYYLAGEQAEFALAKDHLLAEGKENPQSAWPAAQLLLVSRDFDAAIDYLKPGHPGVAFQLLVARQQFAEALKLARAEPGASFDRAWFDGIPLNATPGSIYNSPRHAYCRDVACLLHDLGRDDDAERVVKVMRESLAEISERSPREWMQASIAEALMRMGQAERGIEAYSALLDEPRTLPFRQVASMYGDQRREWAFAVFRHQRRRPMLPPASVQAADLDRLVGLSAHAISDESWTKLFRETYEACQQISARFKLAMMRDMIRVCQHRGNDEQLQVVLADLEKFSPEQAAYARGELAFARRDWQAVVRELSKPDLRNQPVEIQLRLAIAKEELADQAVEAIRMRQWRSFPDPGVAAVSAALRQEGGLLDKANADLQLAVRLLPPGSDASFRAKVELADCLAELSPSQAILGWEHWTVLPVLANSDMPIHEYSERASRILAAKGREAMAKREYPSAIEFVRQAYAAHPPAGPDLANELLALAKAEPKGSASGLLRQIEEDYTRKCAEFPRAPDLQLQLARLQARTGIRLDEALAHCDQAAKLGGKTIPYYAALSQVHFARQEHEQAHAAIQAGLKVDPHDVDLRQLERQIAAKGAQ